MDDENPAKKQPSPHRIDMPRQSTCVYYASSPIQGSFHNFRHYITDNNYLAQCSVGIYLIFGQINMYFLLHLELKFRVIQTRSNSLDLRVGIGAKGRETTVKHHFQYLSTKVGWVVWYRFGKYGGGERKRGRSPAPLTCNLGILWPAEPTTPHVQQLERALPKNTERLRGFRASSDASAAKCPCSSC